MTEKFFRKSDWLACWATFVISLIVYVLTLQPTRARDAAILGKLAKISQERLFRNNYGWKEEKQGRHDQ